MQNTSVCTLYPSRLTITPQRNANTLRNLTSKALDKYITKDTNQTYIENFKVKKNNFIMSKASKKKLFDSINSMYVLSKPRTITMATGKQIYNFRMSFVTLTLPSKQTNSDVEVKSKYLNQFLIEIRKHYGVKNFVWKAELQKNENIHFHLILDKYVDYQALRRRWNRILSKGGYVQTYQNKFSALSLLDYNSLVNKSKKTDFKIISKRYASGKKSNWSNPNSVDVKSVKSKKELAIYLAKYVSKDISDSETDSETNDRQINFGRSWSRSYSLAKLQYKNKFEFDDLQELITYFYNTPEIAKYYCGQFYEVFYFNFSSLSKRFKSLIQFYVRANAKLYNYPFPC